MAVVKITQFGGEMPSASSRNIPLERARTSVNLLARVPEFRPLRADIQVSSTTQTDAKSMVLLPRTPDGAGGSTITTDPTNPDNWLSLPEHSNFVVGQSSDYPARVYLTADGSGYSNAQAAADIAARLDMGSAPDALTAFAFDHTTVPKVIKQLGVPRPASAPAGVATIVGEYSTNEDSLARTSLPAALLSALNASLSRIIVGKQVVDQSGSILPVGAGYAGWLPHGFAVTLTGDDNGRALPTSKPGDWVYAVSMHAGSSGMVLDNPDLHNFLLADGFHGAKITHEGRVYWAVPITMQGQGYAFDVAGFSAKAKAIPYPDDTVPGQMFPDANIASVAANLSAMYQTTSGPLMTALQANYTAHVGLGNAVAAYNTSVKTATSVNTTAATGTAGRDALISSMATTISYLRPQDKNYVAGILTKWVSTDAATGRYNLDVESTFAELDTWQKHFGNIDSQELHTILVGNTFGDIGSSTIPDATTVAASTDSRVAAVLEAIRVVNASSAAITAAFDVVQADMQSRVGANFFSDAVAPFLPTPVERIVEDRFYVATLVSSWDEESAPSLVSAQFTVDQNDYVTIERPPIPPGRFIAGWRLYRTNSGSEQASFQLVTDKTAPQAVLDADGNFKYFDANNAAAFEDKQTSASLQEVIGTTTWAEPPRGLRGLTAMPGGILAGFYSTLLCFSVANVPYAWPVEFQIPVKYPIVGLGAFGNSLFVGTRGTPYVVVGVDPASMSAQELPGQQACVSSRSIVSVEGGVLYASPDGICRVDSNGVRVITSDLFTHEDWIALNPSSILAATHDGVYYFMYDTAAPVNVRYDPDNASFRQAVIDLWVALKQLVIDGHEDQARSLYNAKQAQYGFTDAFVAGILHDKIPNLSAEGIGQWKSGAIPINGWKANTAVLRGCYALDFIAGKLTKVALQEDGGIIFGAANAFHTDLMSDTLYVLKGNAIYAMFGHPDNRRTGFYGTGKIKFAKQEALAWLQVDSDYSAPITIRWYGDGQLRYQTTLALGTDPERVRPVRLPPGRYLEHEVEIETQARVTSVTLAGSTQELQSA